LQKRTQKEEGEKKTTLLILLLILMDLRFKNNKERMDGEKVYITRNLK